jgi:hypothetical protein
MTFQEVKPQIDKMSDHEKDVLAAYLEQLKSGHEDEYKEAARRLKDTNPDHWIPWEKIKSEMAEDE